MRTKAVIGIWLSAITLAWMAVLPVDLGVSPLVDAQGTATGWWQLRQHAITVSGLWSIGLMSLTMVLALRLPLLEGPLGGMDQVYRLHKWAGIGAALAAIAHWGAKEGSDILKALWGRAGRPPREELLAWFTDLRLKLKGQTFFKTVIYMPNLIMASAFAMLFFALFSDNGPVNAALVGMGILKEPFSFLNSVWGNRGLIGLMNFLMWFGNTTIMLMAAIMGVDPTLYEAAELDGCTPNQMFWKITIPLIRPILVYVMITSMIGGLQMFDVPQILTNGKGGPDRTSTTMIMYLNNHLFSKNYGMAGAVSVVLFLVCAVLCVVVYFSLTREDDGLTKAQRRELKAARKAAAKGGK